MSTIIPFTSENVMIVSSNGARMYDYGWHKVLENFEYRCPKNDGTYNRRIASPYIAFYRTYDPKAITHWARVERITEDETYRVYELKTLTKLSKPIPIGKIPPGFSGGCVEISFDNLFTISNMDEIYSKYRKQDNEIDLKDRKTLIEDNYKNICFYLETTAGKSNTTTLSGGKEVKYNGLTIFLSNPTKQGFDICFTGEPYIGIIQDDCNRMFSEVSNVKDFSIWSVIQPYEKKHSTIRLILKKQFYDILVKGLTSGVIYFIIGKLVNQIMIYNSFVKKQIVN